MLTFQWGVNTKAWDDKFAIIRVMPQPFPYHRNLTPGYVELFVFVGVISVALVAWAKCLGDNAMVPLMIFI